MNWVDYTALGILGLFLLYGFTRGFVRQILGIIGIVAGLFLAGRYSPDLARADFWKGMREQNPHLPEIVSYILIFIGVAAASGILIALIWRAFPKRELRGTDSLLGAVLGALEGVLIVGGISIALLDWNDPKAEAVHKSVLAPKFAKGCKDLVSLIPQEKQVELKDGVEGAKEKVEKAFPDGVFPDGAPEKGKGPSMHADPPPPPRG